MAFVSLSAIVPRASRTPARCTRLTRREALRAAGTGLTARLFVVRASAADVVTQTDVTVGTGKDVAQGATLKVHYTLTLDGWEGEPGAKVVDSSRSRGRPFRYNYGVGQVIKGWDQGVTGMKVGGRRKLVIPASLGYGDRGAGGVIPPGATLYFDIELLGVNS